MKKMIILMTLLLGLGFSIAGCKQGEVTETGEVNGEAATDAQIGQSLTERGITLAAGVERANLSGTDGSGITTRELKTGQQTYTVIADLPTPMSGTYMAWLKKSDAEVINLGALTYEKGGFVVEKTTSEDWSSYPGVIVSQEEGSPSLPTTVKLTGSF